MSDDKDIGAADQGTKFTNAAVFYADGIVGMGAGAFTSRVTLASDGLGDNISLNPLTLVMPTQALYAMALHIVATLSSEESIKRMKNLHSNLEEMLIDPEAAVKLMRSESQESSE